jgi:hypothetical protein
MNHLFRAFVAALMILCFSCSSMFGNSVTVRHAMGRAGQPQIPELTTEQFKECGELVQEGLKPGLIPIDARIEVDQDGHVLEATTKGEPNPEVGMCLRGALRDLHVDKEVIDQAKRRATSSSAPKVSTIPSRVYVGQVVEVITVTVVTIVYVEVIIDVSVVALAVAVTATVHLAFDAALAASAAPAARKPQQPNPKKWTDKGGTIQENADGSTTYTRADGVTVTYDKEGYPDFTSYRHPTVKDVEIEFTASYPKDNGLADKAAGITREMRTNERYVWHHHQDGKTMQLIKKDVHEDFFHTGGMSRERKENGECESTE